MNTQASIVRRLLLVALACNLLAASPAAQAQPSAQKKSGKILTDFSCKDLLVVISGTSASVIDVRCTHGNYLDSLPENGAIASGKPAVFLLEQGAFYGPDCTIRVTSGTRRAALSVQQNFCSLAAGNITASVKRGRAALKAKAEGAYDNNIPGTVWFTLDF